MERALRIIAIETSGRHGSVATLSGEPGAAKLIGQITLSGDERTAQALAPALQKLLRDAGWWPDSVDVVAVAVGPGSFTGLRIGVTTAKAFAYAVGADVVGVNTLEALAQQTPPSPAALWTILDAQRQELFAAKFVTPADGQLRADRETTIISQEAWLAELQPGDRVTGPALTRLAEKLPAGVVVIATEFWQPQAEAVGSIAWQAYEKGHRDDVWKLAPNYYRLSAAEEKAAANI